MLFLPTYGKVSERCGHHLDRSHQDSRSGVVIVFGAELRMSENTDKKLVVTIDTEEDSWNPYSAEENTVKNVERIIPLQKLFDEYGVTPTYMVTYPVATNPRSVAILKRIL